MLWGGGGDGDHGLQSQSAGVQAQAVPVAGQTPLGSDNPSVPRVPPSVQWKSPTAEMEEPSGSLVCFTCSGSPRTWNCGCSSVSVPRVPLRWHLLDEYGLYHLQLNEITPAKAVECARPVYKKPLAILTPSVRIVQTRATNPKSARQPSGSGHQGREHSRLHDQGGRRRASSFVASSILPGWLRPPWPGIP